MALQHRRNGYGAQKRTIPLPHKQLTNIELRVILSLRPCET